jgi:hypothetical protein
MGGMSVSTDDLPSVAREVEDFVSTAGWDQAPQLFALVPTTDLLSKQPELAGQVDGSSALTPVAQEDLPDTDLATSLASIMWPEVVRGCALAQEIVVLPPEAEASLRAEDAADPEAMRRAAEEHPQRREARLVAAVLRDGSVACVLRMRGQDPDTDEIVENPDLAPNLTRALLSTLRP